MPLSKYRDMVIAKELSYVGVTGGSASGDDEFIRYYNKIAGCNFSVSTTPWCAIFQTYNLRMCNIPTWVCPNFAGCGTIDDGFLKPAGFHKAWNNYIPLPGDLIIFDWSGNHCSRDHVGMVEKVEGNTVYTIEGNSNGGYSVPGVRHKSYDLKSKYISLYGAIPYEAFEQGCNPYPAPNCELKNGMNSVYVRWLQWYLNVKMGMTEVVIDGGFGAKTLAALKKCQEKMGLSVTGVADSATISKIAKNTPVVKASKTTTTTTTKKTTTTTTTTTKTTTTSTTKIASPVNITEVNELHDTFKKMYIKNFQKWMNNNFKKSLVCDGEWGPKSHKASIEVFQELCNQTCGAKLVVDGEWGPKTRIAAGKSTCLIKGTVTNNFVYLLKGMLVVNGYSLGALSVKCDTKLVETIKRYQTNHKFVKAQCDGECGQNTWTELFTKTKWC